MPDAQSASNPENPHGREMKARFGRDLFNDFDIDDPRFSLNEALSTRVAFSMAETLGVSLGGVATGVGALGQKGVEAAGEATKGAVRQLFGGRKE